ncbi:hypothetical protein [Paenibacillus thalictri]|uniref:Uncharacterized protein n=1 Tax=Paenibacillus thalictri TaxID=2527873 RepID=A0A4Q9DVP0_9BACL|nr:hypothetical protein [Paenibacillus thalictri]TBL81089.1 hypothetical protein EYB31_03065 [Paenibacillus thalictri]
MLSRRISLNRLFSLILIAVFMLFATPTPSLEGNANESARTAATQGIEYFTNKATVRKMTSASEGLRFAALLAALSTVLRSLTYRLRRMLPESRLSFRPHIARRLARMLLTPARFSSLYV